MSQAEHRRTPRVAHWSAQARRRSGTARGMAPSECEQRYVARSRVGNSGRKCRSGSFAAAMMCPSSYHANGRGFIRPLPYFPGRRPACVPGTPRATLEVGEDG